MRLPNFSWLVQYQIESDIVFPGVGYFCMVIQAVRYARTSMRIAEDAVKYRIRYLVATNDLMIPNHPSDIEVVFTFRDCIDAELDHRVWYDFTIWPLQACRRW